MFEVIVQKTLTVPTLDGVRGDGSEAARQLDIALMGIGFKLSRELLEHLSECAPSHVVPVGRLILNAVSELVGDHVQHNVYFKNFPEGVPDTLTFWSECIASALYGDDAEVVARVQAQLQQGAVNLLDLPSYGRYQHTYEDMLEAHDAFMPGFKDRVTVLHLGLSVEAEMHKLYLSLASRNAPLSEDDRALLTELTIQCRNLAQPERIPMRENRAIINAARFEHGVDPIVDTYVDVLRLACALSGGDVTLSTPTRFRSFRRAERRRLMAALDGVSGLKLGDTAPYTERFKRLAERIHPHEYPQFPNAQAAFRIVYYRNAQSLNSRVDEMLCEGSLAKAIVTASEAPGLLVRNVDRFLRLADSVGATTDRLVLGKAVSEAIPHVSSRVLLSLREHLINREATQPARIFVNQQGRAWVTPDNRSVLKLGDISALNAILDNELASRFKIDTLVIDPEVEMLAIPVSEKTRPGGLGVMPRGSITPVGDRVRFFIHWHQMASYSDLDLSVLLLGENFEYQGQVSWTSLSLGDIKHSGDITSAPNGASEFIDVDLSTMKAKYVVPQVYVFGGEGFDELAEVFFGFMQRDEVQKGKPFEPRTVRMKSDLSGGGRVALPMVFVREEHGWTAKWLHLNSRGSFHGNRVETNRLNIALLLRSLVERQYLPMGYLTGLMIEGAGTVRRDRGDSDFGDQPVTYVGIERPEGLPQGSTVYTTTNLADLIP